MTQAVPPVYRDFDEVEGPTTVEIPKNVPRMNAVGVAGAVPVAAPIAVPVAAPIAVAVAGPQVPAAAPPVYRDFDETDDGPTTVERPDLASVVTPRPASVPDARPALPGMVPWVPGGTQPPPIVAAPQYQDFNDVPEPATSIDRPDLAVHVPTATVPAPQSDGFADCLLEEELADASSGSIEDWEFAGDAPVAPAIPVVPPVATPLPTPTPLTPPTPTTTPLPPPTTPTTPTPPLPATLTPPSPTSVAPVPTLPAAPPLVPVSASPELAIAARSEAKVDWNAPDPNSKPTGMQRSSWLILGAAISLLVIAALIVWLQAT